MQASPALQQMAGVAAMAIAEIAMAKVQQHRRFFIAVVHRYIGVSLAPLQITMVIAQGAWEEETEQPCEHRKVA